MSLCCKCARSCNGLTGVARYNETSEINSVIIALAVRLT